ncbi:MAG: hypothetical protein JWO92_2003 [Chitinophagaceae bacterium]|nr:hypothetical protein [Chitinophagaceae bacterium]
MNINIKSLGDLETGIKQLLLESRCSLSDKEKDLLFSTLVVIGEFTSQLQKKQIDLNLIVQIVENVTHFLLTAHYLNEFF